MYQLFNTRMMNYIALAVLASVAIFLVVTHTPFGAAMSTDSLGYLSAAKNFALGHGVSLPDYVIGKGDFFPMTTWPPLYPVFLSVFIPSADMVGVRSGAYIAIINIVSLFVLLTIVWSLLSLFIHRVIALLLSVLLAFLPSIQIVYMYAWTETIFIPLLVATCYLQWRFLASEGKKAEKWLWGAVVGLAVLFYIRYAAIGFLGACIASIVLLHRNSWIEKCRLIMVSVALFVLAVLPLLLRNYILTSTLTGSRGWSNIFWLDDFFSILSLLRDELFPFNVWFAVAMLISVILISGYVFLKRRNLAPNILQSCKFAIHLLVWSALYILFLIVIRQVSGSDLDARMMAPIVPLLLIALAFLMGALVTLSRPSYIFLPAAAYVLALFVSCTFIHLGVVASWKYTGTPGQIGGLFYNNVSNIVFSSFNVLVKSVPLRETDLILTDLPRPQILQYFYPSAHIKQLPQNLSEQDLRDLRVLLDRSGLVLLVSAPVKTTFNHVFGDSKSLFQINDIHGKLENQMLLMRLPAPKTTP